MATHGKEGTRERYFADDDRYDLKEMVRREKTNTARNDPMMSKLLKVIIGTQCVHNTDQLTVLSKTKSADVTLRELKHR